MIGFSKLLCGQATVAEAMRQRESGDIEPRMLQFSCIDRPLVVWNVTYRCNLRCAHCYIDAEDRAARHELTSEEAFAFISDLAEMRVPVLLFSGGEPLIRKDVLGLARYAADKGLRPVLSTNGTLIDRPMAGRIRASGLQYAGVSIDGLEATHDRFRCHAGAFQAATDGIRHCLEAGVKAGIRFTLNVANYADLPGVLDLVEELGVPRFCMYHLVYSGRGSALVDQDVTPAQRRHAVNLLIDRVLDWDRRGVDVEVLTTDQHADGAYLLGYVTRHCPERAAEVRRLLEMHGGCSAGCKMSNVDPLGNVHACQFWGHESLGNVKERKFSQIWRDRANATLCALRRKADLVKGKCAGCDYLEVCGGCRIRAEAVFGDVWAEDPACYLTDDERAAQANESH